MHETIPPVCLVGAGPGSPGLLTLRAVECLGQADYVLYDQLVPPRLLDFAPLSAERHCVSELPGPHAARYDSIPQLLIDLARQGRRVVRLKGGDPFLFGRGGEEAEALQRAGIPFEVVPGVTAAIGAAACAGIPLTHRAHASAVAFITGHEEPGRENSRLDWAALARFPGTLVFYMGVSRLPTIVNELLRSGLDVATPAAVVRWGTTPQQQTLTAPLGDLAAAVANAGLRSPALVIVGTVVELRPLLHWFEDRPLFGKRILVTRPRHQAGELQRRLEQLGASCQLLPAVEIREPADWSSVDAAIERIDSYQWLVFTSTNGVQAFLNRLLTKGRDLRALGTVRLAAIGPSTADALRAYHLKADVVPDSFCSEGLAAALKPHVRGQRVLYARADRGRDVLRQELTSIASVEQIAVYSQVDALDTQVPAWDAMRKGEIDVVTLTSSNIAKAIVQALEPAMRERVLAGSLQLATISPVTSEEVRKLGLPVAVEATEYTTNGLMEALLRAV